MAGEKTIRPKARLPRGFRDRSAAEIAAERRMLDIIRGVYESYGFEALETPAFEYTDALGKFLPDVDRPNEGVFSLQDDDKQWMSLRYDLTAPLARYVAANFQNLPKPFRRYQVGSVWRNEKPGPGRYREFTQFDADTVGSNSPAADAELLMMVCDALEALGLKRGEYVVKVNSRMLLDGLLESLQLEGAARLSRSAVLRAIDKLDRLGPDAVFQLLTAGRKDESGDFTEGAKLEAAQADKVMQFLNFAADIGGHYTEQGAAAESGNNAERIARLGSSIAFGVVGELGLKTLTAIAGIARTSGYGDGRIVIDPTIVRGLDYYTGPVFEAQLSFPTMNDDGEEILFGSVAGGGRYDDLVARFTGQSVPATGISIGVSRLMAALKSRGLSGGEIAPLVLVLLMDDAARSFELARALRNAGIRAEAYVGTKKMQDQLKYADKRGAAIAVIEGADERAKGELQLKDLALGTELARNIESRAEWVKERPAQMTVKEDDLISEVRKILSAQASIAKA